MDINSSGKYRNYVKPFYWSGRDKIDNEGNPYFSFVIYAHEYNTGKTVALHVKYEPWIDIVLPDSLISSNASLVADMVFQGLKSILWKSKHGPTRYELSERLPLYYYTTNERYVMKTHFQSEDALRHCRNLLKKPLNLRDQPDPIPLLLAGTNNGQIERLHAELDIRPCDWIAFEVSSLVHGDEKVTTCDLEFNLDWNNIIRLDVNIQQNLGQTYPSFLVFDHEMFSSRKYAFPDELNSNDVIFMTGLLHCVYNREFHKYDVNEYCLVYHKTLKKEDIKPIPCTKLNQLSAEKYEVMEGSDSGPYVILHFYGDEISLINDVEKFIRILDPEGVVGHNSDSFDFKYHKVRKGRLAENYTNMSRISNWNQGFENIQWESSAYHEINLWVPDGDGRLYFDTMLMAKRDYKEDSYGLDALCKRFMGIGKHEWSPADIFDSFNDGSPDKLRTTIKYCMQDVWCTWGLFQHLSFWESYSGMSNITGVGIFELFSRGQQIRTITQMFKECYKEGYFLHAPDRHNRKIAGGHVFDQIPGLYEWVLLLDFEGLYPSIMRRYNISNDTFDKDKTAKDEDCYIFNWEDDHGKWETRFVKQHIRKGLVPKILEKYYGARNEAKARMAECKKNGDSRGAMVYNVEQLGNKLSSNSVYGGITQNGGKLSLSEAGAAVTAYGRMSIQKAAKWANDRGWDVVYGDSVTGNTPIFIRKNGVVSITTIESLYDNTKMNDNIVSGDGKEYKIPDTNENLETWSDKGWTAVNNIMRHKTNKRIYKVLTHTGYVEVTEDHSLLRDSNIEVTPKEVKIGDKLLNSYPDTTGNHIEHNLIYPIEFITTSQIEAAHYYNYYTSEGYKVTIKLIQSHPIEIKLTATNVNILNANEITCIEVLQEYEPYVYDLTTENHHFQAGIGDIIVHNTDSIMIKKKGELTDEEKYNFLKLGHEMANQMNSECFQAPIRMEVDGAFRTMHSISKKMYSFISLDPIKPLEINPELWKSKGLVTAKRDSCKMIRNLYEKLEKMVTGLVYITVIIETLAAEIERLLRGELHIGEMISIRKLGKGYVNKNSELPTFQKHLHDNGMNVKPGDRLPFVYALRDKCTHQGEKWEDPDIFLRENMEYDRIQYLKSQIQNKIDTQLHTAFPDIIPPTFLGMLPKMLDLRPNESVINLLLAVIDAYVTKNNM